MIYLLHAREDIIMKSSYYTFDDITTAKKCVDLAFENVLKKNQITQDYHNFIV